MFGKLPLNICIHSTTSRILIYTSLPQLEQLRLYGQTLGGAYPLGLRVNPGIGSGGTGKTNVGGPDSSFGKDAACNLLISPI